MKKNTDYQLITFENMLKKRMKNSAFKAGYEKEVARLHLIREIKHARLAKKLTQRKLAEKADMPQSTIARIESGRQGLSLSTVTRIAAVLGKQLRLV